MLSTSRTISVLAGSLLALAPLLAHSQSADAALAQAAASHQVDNPDLLPPEKAFNPKIYRAGKEIVIDYRIADGYYLYRSRMSFDSQPAGKIGAPVFPAGETKVDQFFGQQVIYKHEAITRLPIQSAGPDRFTVTVHYQGCAGTAGVCYPPQTRELKIDGPSLLVRDPAAPSTAVAQTQSIAPPTDSCAQQGRVGHC